MASSSSRSSLRPGFGRRLLSLQWLYFVVAIALFAVVWITNRSRADLPGVVVYAFVTGNLTTVAMNRFAPWFMSVKAPYHWPAYVSCLFVSALASSALGVLLILVMFRLPFSDYRAEF